MKNKTRKYLIAAGTLAALVIAAQAIPHGTSRVADALKFNNSYTGKALRSFDVRDTAAVTRIFMVDKNNRSVTLERKGGDWRVNNEYDARRDAVNILLTTLHKMRVKMPVASSAREEIFRKMAGRSIKVEVYQGRSKAKVFYVGGVTPDNLGSYMLLEGSETPYILEIHGFRGFLSSRFSTDLRNWRSSVLVGEIPDQIKSIEIRHRNHPEQNFRAEQPEPRRYTLYNGQGENAGAFDTLAVRTLYEQFEIANILRFVTQHPDEVKDSVMASTPLLHITLVDGRDSTQNYRFYEIPRIAPPDDEMERSLYPESLWAFNNLDEWMLVQTYPYLLMFKGLSDFRPATK